MSLGLLFGPLPLVGLDRREGLCLLPRPVRRQVLVQPGNLRSCDLDDLGQHRVSHRLCGSALVDYHVIGVDRVQWAFPDTDYPYVVA